MIVRQGKVPVKIYADERLAPSEKIATVLNRIAALKVLSSPVIGLPDLYHKPQMECPSSVATATRAHVVLSLSSPSPHCGMALARTHLHLADMDDDMIDRLFDALVRCLGQVPALSMDDMTDVLLRGAASAVDTYHLPQSLLEYMDQQGNAFTLAGANREAILRAIPPDLRKIGARDFAQLGRGNHFFELQVVEELCDEQIALSWGLEKDMIVAMYHADSGRLGAMVGRLYAHRRKNSWRGRLYEWKVKLPFHLSTGRPTRLMHRIYYHVWPHFAMPLPADSEEAQQTLIALQAAGNYANANRMAVLASLRDAIRSVWGEQYDTPALLWDAPHNSIRWEQINGQGYWVHRHNAATAAPPSQMPATSPFAATGQPVLLPGMDCTSSYVCVAGEVASQTLHSVNHGAGYLALKLGQPLDDGCATRKYSHDDGFIGLLPHLSDDGVDGVLEALCAHDIAQPVARLRPLAVLKDFR